MSVACNSEIIDITAAPISKGRLPLGFKPQRMEELATYNCQKIKLSYFAHANRWFGGDPSTHGDQPIMFTTYYYGPFKSKGPKTQPYDMFSLAQW